MFTFKAIQVEGSNNEYALKEQQENIEENNKEKIEKLENIEHQISPINNNMKITFKLDKEKDKTGEKKVLSELVLEKNKSSYNEKQSQLFTQALKDYNLNSIDYSRFQDFILSSQNNNSLHFDINNINILLNVEEEKENDIRNLNNNNPEDIATYKKKIVTSLNSKFNSKRMGNMPTPIKEHNEFFVENANVNIDNDIVNNRRETNEQKMINKYQHVFGDVEQNTSRSNRSYYDSHQNRSKSRKKVDVDGDFTNLKNNTSLISTGKDSNNVGFNEEEAIKKKYYSSRLGNVINSMKANNEAKENSKYNFNSNLFIEEQKLRESKEINLNARDTSQRI